MLLRNSILLLLLCGQALYRSRSLIGIALTSLVGVQLTPLSNLATLPLALLVLGNLLAVQPLPHSIQRHSRRPGLMLGADGGVLSGLVCAAGIWTGDLLWFYLDTLGIGVYQVSVVYYRFAALEAADAGRKDRASAYMLTGGVLAALLAPSLALRPRNALAQPFVGTYLLIAALALAGLLLMALLREGQTPRPARPAQHDINGLLRRPMVRTAIAYAAAGHGLMILVMNVTPLAMSFCGLLLEQLSRVVQQHVLGVFLPAFFAGALVDRIGNRRVALLSAFLLAASTGITLDGRSVIHSLLGSLVLGSGWNLMLITGTAPLGKGHAEGERGAA